MLEYVANEPLSDFFTYSPDAKPLFENNRGGHERCGRGECMMEKRIADILQKMSLKEKITLCNGADFWHSKAM